MSDNKMNLSDLFQELAMSCGISKASAELFAKAFFAQIEEGLLKDGMVKINNFGTFKAQWNEARKSVNINTGEEIVIPAHPRITFSPEQEIKDRINHPFAYLQPTPIGKTVLEKPEIASPEVTPETENHMIESVGDTLQKLNDDADEIKALLCDINGEDWMREDNGQQDEDVCAEIITQEEEKTTEENVTEVVEVEANVVDEQEEEKETEEPTQPDVTETEVISTPPREVMVNNTRHETAIPPKKGTFWKIAVSVTIALCLLAIGAYVYVTQKVENWAEKRIASATDTEETLKVESTVTEDTTLTLGVLSEDSIASVLVAETMKDEDSTAEVAVTYQEFIDTVQLTEGSRLAWLAKKYYGSAYFWVYIYEANKEQLPNPNDIPVGTTINIPKLPQELIDPTNEECISKAKELQNEILNK